MLRKLVLVGLAGLSLVAWGTTMAFAMSPQGMNRNLTPNHSGLAPTLRPQGLLITGVLPGGPAAQQGLEPGDVILGVNGYPVRSITDLNVLLLRAGWTVQLEVLDGRSGVTTPVLIYPVNGRIGIYGEAAPLGPIIPPTPLFPSPRPVFPGNPGLQPRPLPYPGNPLGR